MEPNNTAEENLLLTRSSSPSYDGSDTNNIKNNQNLCKRFWVESMKVWKIAFPTMVTRVTSFGVLVVTQSFMGYIGDTELAAYSLMQIFLLRFANGILLGMASALETFCGQAYGAKQYQMMGIYLQRSWIILLITTMLITPIFIFSTSIFRLLGEGQELSVVAGNLSLWCIPILYYFVFDFTLQMYLQAQVKNMIVGWLSAAAFVLHIILSWVFVIKLNLGVPGAMGAMIISTWSTVIGLFIYVCGGWCADTWTGLSISAFSELLPVVRLSLSSGVMLCVELWYNAVLVLLAGYLKHAEISISAFSICLNILGWQFMIFLGFATAACVRVSNELGAGNVKAAQFSVKVIMTTSVSLGVVFWILTLVFGNSISYLFSSSNEVAKAVSSLSVLLAFSVLLNSIQPVLSGVAIGAGWQTLVAYVNITCYYIIGIPIGLLLAYVFHFQAQGIWIGMICGVAMQTLALIYFTWKTDWDAQVEAASARLKTFLRAPEEYLTE
ncbi:protein DETOXIFICATION 20-like isoform X1 [Papaver somniferum]|uniref:protein DETOXIFICATION 20-like isoform X1 n=2 Tax=Papaver somniferum TaxID=3469 RepID=UPI000E6FCB11|nr:protein DETOXIFICATION 20-like isoform X1 [Papaver somniferum]